MKYHVITPFSRFEHIVPLTEMLYHATTDRLVWHPIVDRELKFQLAQSEWVEPMVCPGKVDGWFMGHYKENWFIEHAEIVDTDRYLVLNDDDAYGTDFFQKIDLVKGDCLICSMRRNSRGDLLTAAPYNLLPCKVGGEQIVVTGEILKRFRWGEDYTGDWDFIKAVTEKYPPVFVPEAEVFWNYYRPGQWFPA
jgi:hypothetical protein